MQHSKLTVAAAVAVSAMLGVGKASAADLPMKAPPMVAAPIPSSWTGFYVGGNGGYAWGGNEVALISQASGTGTLFTFPAIPPPPAVPQSGTASYSPSGGFGGVQVGYNYQFRPKWVAGVEADIQGALISGSGAGPIKTVFSDPFFGFPDWAVNGSATVNWFGTARARIGFLPTNDLLLYATGGLAYGEIARTASVSSTTFGATGGSGGFSCAKGTVCFTQTDRNTQVGWTAGIGAEYAFGSNVTLKAEYLHVDLGGGGRTFFLQATQPPGTATMTASFGSGAQFDLVRVGFNFKFGAAPVVAKY